MSRWTRLLLWDYSRGSLAYELLWLILLGFLVLAPPELLGDPMTRHR